MPGVVLGALNHLIDEVGRGTPVFHELYTPAEQQDDPTKASTGLFFFRGRPDAPFALIAPGGGFSYVGSVHEGFPYALEISREGYNAFVLRYRVGQGGGAATEDMWRRAQRCRAVPRGRGPPLRFPCGGLRWHTRAPRFISGADHHPAVRSTSWSWAAVPRGSPLPSPRVSTGSA